MAAGRHVIVAGAGIAGLTAAIALARVGLRVTVWEQAEKLEEAGAGLQLSPNATRVLIELGLRDALRASATVPQILRVISGRNAKEIARIPLGDAAESRYGSPYWVMHRADLQSALAAAARREPDVSIRLGVRLEDFAAHEQGVSALGRGTRVVDERAIALIGADGMWSHVRARLGERPPRFRHRTAWRALVSADALPAPYRDPVINLWTGPDAHLVHYPVRSGTLVNIVAIVHDVWNEPGWNAPGDPKQLAPHFGRFAWAEHARALIRVPQHWHKWALHDRRGPYLSNTGPVTLIGDAAHPMLPFLAQGAGLAIEDAAVLADAFARNVDKPVAALRAYEHARHARAARVQKAARRQGRIYGMSGPEALIRNIAMRAMGNEKLLSRFDWLYAWRSPSP